MQTTSLVSRDKQCIYFSLQITNTTEQLSKHSYHTTQTSYCATKTKSTEELTASKIRVHSKSRSVPEFLLLLTVNAEHKLTPTQYHKDVSTFLLSSPTIISITVRKVVKGIEILHLHTDHKLQVRCQAIPKLILHECQCAEGPFTLNAAQHQNNCKFCNLDVLAQRML
jgi:hypothetical protein